MNTQSPRLRTVLMCVLCALPLAAAAPAQEKKEGKQERPVEPLHVRLDAAVYDAQNRPVTDLQAGDFEVYEDGVPQKLTHFARREGPLFYGLVVDNSGSFHTIINDVVALARAFVADSGPDSAGFVVRFVGSDTVKILHGLTTDKAELAAAVDDMFIEGGQTAINDAVYLSAEYLAKFKVGHSVPRRYALVLITDGEDRASYYKAEAVHRKLREAGTPVFAVGIVNRNNIQISPGKARKYLERLAFESGGRAYFAEKPGELASSVRRILEDLNAPYALGYDSTNPKRDGRPRKLEVRAKNSAGPLTVRAQSEYTAPDKK